MERLKLKFEDSKKALDSLKEILNEPYSVIVRDATIQRFEFTFEAFWKFLKEYLKSAKGAIVSFPKDCFREILPIGICTEEEIEVLLKMTDSRNQTAHTYNEKIANEIYSKIESYTKLMDKIIGKIKDI